MLQILRTTDSHTLLLHSQTMTGTAKLTIPPTTREWRWWEEQTRLQEHDPWKIKNEDRTEKMTRLETIRNIVVRTLVVVNGMSLSVVRYASTALNFTLSLESEDKFRSRQSRGIVRLLYCFVDFETQSKTIWESLRLSSTLHVFQHLSEMERHLMLETSSLQEFPLLASSDLKRCLRHHGRFAIVDVLSCFRAHLWKYRIFEYWTLPAYRGA